MTERIVISGLTACWAQALDSCAVAFSDGKLASFEERFFVRTDADKRREENDGRQASKIYVLTAGGRKQLLTVAAPAVCPVGHTSSQRARFALETVTETAHADMLLRGSNA